MEFEDSVKTFANEQYFCRHLNPKDGDDATKCLIFIFHGFCEHVGRYDELFESFQNRNFYTFSHDLYGHGQTSGRRIWVRSYDVLTTAAQLHIEETKARFPGKKMFVYGHSMGGLGAIRLIQQHPDLADGLIMEGPLLGLPTVVPKWVISVAVLLGKNKVTAPIKIGKFDKTKLTKTPEVNDKYETDPLVNRSGANARVGASSMKAKKLAFGQAKSFKTPFFIGHGSHDELCPYSGSVDFYDVVGTTDKTLRRYEEGLHVLRVEQNKDIGKEFVREIIEWIENHLD